MEGVNVSPWASSRGQAECRECEWACISFSPAQVISWAVYHTKTTGHTVDVSRKARAYVTPQVEAPNPHVQRAWIANLREDLA